MKIMEPDRKLDEKQKRCENNCESTQDGTNSVGVQYRKCYRKISAENTSQSLLSSLGSSEFSGTANGYQIVNMILRLQKFYGNNYVQRLIQAKSTAGRGSSKVPVQELTNVLSPVRSAGVVPMVQRRPEKGGVQHVEFEMEFRSTEILEAYSETIYPRILGRLRTVSPWPGQSDRETEARRLTFEIMDIHEQVPLEPMQTYRYRLELWLSETQGPQGLMVTLISPGTTAAPRRTGSGSQFESPGATRPREREQSPEAEKGAQAPQGPERVREALEGVDDALAKMDTILEWGERLATDRRKARILKNLRDEMKRVQDPLSQALKAERVASRTAELVYAINAAAEHEAGSKEAINALVGLAEPAGELAKAVADYAPPGVSHFLEALGEAAISFPNFVEDIKEKMRPSTERRRPERPYVIP